uniref:Uncharacterized protein n=1 Tax=Falco tinnunculus TaxID=100819 RepID=A0A8C4XRK8_FALTI
MPEANRETDGSFPAQPLSDAGPGGGGKLGLKTIRSLLPAPSVTHRLRLWRCEYDQLPTSLAHTSVAGPGPDSTAARGAHRDAPYSTTASRNRLDTAQMATTSHTFVAADADASPSAPAAARSPGPEDDEPAAARAASAPSTSDTLSVAVTERAGSPWSRTTMTSRCRGPSASSSARALLFSRRFFPSLFSLFSPVCASLRF